MTRKTQKQETEYLKDRKWILLSMILVSALMVSIYHTVVIGNRITALESHNDALFDVMNTAWIEIHDLREHIGEEFTEWVCTSNKTVQKIVDVEEWCFDKYCPYNKETYPNVNCHKVNGVLRCDLPKSPNSDLSYLDCEYDKLENCLAQDTDGDGYAVVSETECDEWMLKKVKT